MIVAYMAHPVGGDVPGNIAKAKRWLTFLQRTYPDRAFVAPWIDWIEFAEGLDDADPKAREIGMQRDLAVVRRCDEIWLVGGYLSPGMKREEHEFLLFAQGVGVRAQHLMTVEPPQ